MTAIDVNAQFATEKIAQLADRQDIASGAKANRIREARLSDLRKRVADGSMSERSNADGSITFTALTGWDRNETWNVSKAQAVNENVVIQPNHGLDTKANGDVALYLNGTNGPAWHGLGTVIPGGLSDGDSVLKAAGLDWDVVKVPSLHRKPVLNTETGIWEPTGELVEDPDGCFKTARVDTGASLGAVGSIYTPLQNREAYGMLEELIGLGMVCESAGSMDGGRRVFVTAEIPSALIVDPTGVANEVRQFLAILNSHNGKTPLTAVVTPWRVLCGNTHRFALKSPVKWTIRHTKTAKDRLDMARKSLGLTVDYYAEFAAEETELAQAEGFTNGDLDELIKDIWELKPGKTGKIEKRAETMHKARTEKIHEIFEFESSRVGKTAYAAENAVTAYVDHFAELRPRGDLRGNRLAALGQAIMNETFDEVKATAHGKLLLKVRGR